MISKDPNSTIPLTNVRRVLDDKPYILRPAVYISHFTLPAASVQAGSSASICLKEQEVRPSVSRDLLHQS